MASARSTFRFDPGRQAAEQVDAALEVAAPRRRPSHFRLEIGLAALALLTALAAAGPCYLPRGLVAARPIRAGSVLGVADVRLVPIPARAAFSAADQVAGLVAARDLEPGEPLRPTAIAATWVAARESIARGEVVAPAALELRAGPYLEDGFRDLSPVGRSARTAIVAGTFLRESMLEPGLGARVARRDIRPFELLTVQDVADPPPRACVLAPIARGAPVRDSDLVTLDPGYDTLLAIELANAPARTAPGSPATLVLVPGGGEPSRRETKSVQVQLLRVTPAGGRAHAVVATPASERMDLIGAQEIHVVQEVEPP